MPLFVTGEKKKRGTKEKREEGGSCGLSSFAFFLSSGIPGHSGRGKEKKSLVERGKGGNDLQAGSLHDRFLNSKLRPRRKNERKGEGGRPLLSLGRWKGKDREEGGKKASPPTLGGRKSWGGENLLIPVEEEEERKKEKSEPVCFGVEKWKKKNDARVSHSSIERQRGGGRVILLSLLLPRNAKGETGPLVQRKQEDTGEKIGTRSTSLYFTSIYSSIAL